MENFTAAITALVNERDRQFLVRVAQDFNLPLEKLTELHSEVMVTAIKVPRKYTKKPKAVTVVTTEDPTAAVMPKPAKEPKAKAEKAKCTACTSKKEPCKFSALKGEVFCKRHLRASQEEEAGSESAKPKEPKKTAAAKKATAQPVHTHALDTVPEEPCTLCESHGNPLIDTDTAEFEVVIGPTVAERLAALLTESGDDADSDAESNSEFIGDLAEEAFEDD